MGNTKRKRSKPVNATPWSKCGLSLKNWKEMLSTISFDITEPENIVGLEGLASHGQVWEDWFDAYLNGPLKQNFWSASSEHVFTFARDAKMISKAIRPFVMEAAREARGSVTSSPVEEIPIEPSTGRNHNRFHVLEDLEKEDQIPEIGEKAEVMTISVANEEVNRDQSPNVALTHSHKSEKGGQRQQSDSPCVRAILRPNPKKRTRLVHDLGEGCALAPLNQTIKDNIDKSEGDGGIIQRGHEVSECYTHPSGDDADKTSPARRRLEYLDTVLLQHHGLPSNSLNPHQSEPSPMRDLEYTIVNSPYSKVKLGDWEKVASTIFDWHSHTEKNQETHLRKRCKVNESSIVSAVSEKSNNTTCHPEHSVTLGGEEPPKLVHNLPGLDRIAGELPTSPKTPEHTIICEASIISAAPLSPPMESNDNQNSTRLVSSHHIQIPQGLENVPRLPHISPLTFAGLNAPSQVSDCREAPNPEDNQEETQTPKQQALAAVAGYEILHARPKDITSHVRCADRQNPQPLAVAHNLQSNEPEDPVAVTATLRIASYLVPYERQGCFPPLVFASAGTSKQLGIKFDYCFHYWAHPPSISTFLQELYAKHQIPLQRRLTSLKLIIEGDTLHIEVGRYQGSWDWHIAMDVAKHRNCRVEVIFETE